MNKRTKCFLLFTSTALWIIIELFFSGLVIASPYGAQQGAPLLQITSPADGAIVNPGQTISVTVTSPAGATFTEVGVVGEDPIGFSNLANSAPSQLSITIPTGTACRPFMLTAVGATSAGQSAESATLLIDVERPDLPTAISAEIPKMTFKALGQQFPLVLLATFSDGNTLDVTQSTEVNYSSSDNTIATIDLNGSVTAVAPGSALVTATYAQGTQNIQVSVPVLVPPQVLDPVPGAED
jgi:hypothetical protein